MQRIIKEDFLMLSSVSNADVILINERSDSFEEIKCTAFKMHGGSARILFNAELFAYNVCIFLQVALFDRSMSSVGFFFHFCRRLFAVQKHGGNIELKHRTVRFRAKF